MSQQAITSPITRADAVPRRRPFVNRDELNPLPTIKGREGAFTFIREHLGVPMAATRVRTAIEGRELPVYKISGWNVMAERDLYDWVLSLAQTGKVGAA